MKRNFTYKQTKLPIKNSKGGRSNIRTNYELMLKIYLITKEQNATNSEVKYRKDGQKAKRRSLVDVTSLRTLVTNMFAKAYILISRSPHSGIAIENA